MHLRVRFILLIMILSFTVNVCSDSLTNFNNIVNKNYHIFKKDNIFPKFYLEYNREIYHKVHEWVDYDYFEEIQQSQAFAGTTSIYDNYANILRKLYYGLSYDDNYGILSRESYTYENGRLWNIRSSYSDYHFSMISNSYYYYDNNNNIDYVHTIEDIDEDKYITNYLTDYIYNSDNLLIRTNGYRGEPGDIDTLACVGHTIYEYDNLSRLIRKQKFTYSSLTREYLYTYNDNDLIESSIENTNSHQTRIDYAYGENNELLSTATYSFENDCWVNTYRSEVYNDENYLPIREDMYCDHPTYGEIMVGYQTWNYFTFVANSDTEILQINNINNYPNPFNPETTINFSINEPGKVELSVYNIKGQLVKTILNDFKSRGSHNVVWQGKDNNNKSVASGVYFYKISFGETSVTKKMILMK